jgi:sugar phosphate isomerase/epimerase
MAMEQIKPAIHLPSLRLPLRDALVLAHRMGARAVEIDGRGEPFQMAGGFGETAQRQFRKLLDDLGLRVAAVSFQTHRGYDVADSLDRRINATKEAMTLAYGLGARVVTNSIGRVSNDEEDPGWDRMREALIDIGRHADRCGARLAARTGSEPVDQLHKFIESLPEGTLGVDLDPAGLILNTHPVGEALLPIMPCVLHVRGRDAVRDLAVGRGIEVPLGRGITDFPWLIGALQQHGYRGYITLERRESIDPASEMGAALTFLRTLLG